MYDDMIRDSEQLWYHAKDRAEDPNHGDAQYIINGTHDLLNQMKSGRDNEYLLDRVKHLQATVNSSRDRSDLYRSEDVDAMYDQLTSIRSRLERM